MTDDSTTSSTPAPAGWYPDPALPATERYYDGTTWTESTRQVPTDAVGNTKRRKGWIIGGSIAAAVVLVAVIAGVAVSALSAGSRSAVIAGPSPQASTADVDLVEVPDLVGMTVADARADMDQIGLTLYVPDGTDDQAIIATQTLRAGQEVAAGTEVLVTVTTASEPEGASMSFDDGATLNPQAAVGWQLSLGSDDALWTLSPDTGSGEVIFVSTDGTCTAQYWQETFDSAAADDLAASDEFLRTVSGATAEEIDTYAFDGHFALSGAPGSAETGGEVATRTLLWDSDEGTFLLTARVFDKVDYATTAMNNAYSMQLQCPVGGDPESVVDSLDEVAKISVSQ